MHKIWLFLSPNLKCASAHNCLGFKKRRNFRRNVATSANLWLLVLPELHLHSIVTLYYGIEKIPREGRERVGIACGTPDGHL